MERYKIDHIRWINSDFLWINKFEFWAELLEQQTQTYCRCRNFFVTGYLKISGVPYFRNDSCRQSTQKVRSIEFDNRQESTFREYQSMTATRYINPFGMRI